MLKLFTFFLLIITLITFISLSKDSAKKSVPKQKIIIFMIDGFGEEYYRNSTMPTLNMMEKKGLYKVVPSLMPSVTNLNNTAICTGELPEVNGITGNTFFNMDTQQEEFMEDSSLVLAPTIFERAKKQGIHSALFSSKKKTIALLSRGTDIAISPEMATENWITNIGQAPDIYSKEVNYWTLNAALHTIKNDTSINLFYIHTTDYPMHTWSAKDSNSKQHLKVLDSLISQIIKAAPQAMILITADHTVAHKSVCLDLQKACAKKGLPIKIAISAEKDKYPKHHRGMGGTSYVYLNKAEELSKVKTMIAKFKGVEQVLTRDEAVKKFHLMPQRIGDLVVLGDKNTVFGEIKTEYETLPETYRSHGSIYEAKTPLFIYNVSNAPKSDFFSSNYKLAAWLYR